MRTVDKHVPDTNVRAGEMWDIISARTDFDGKSVIDLGCGHGEMVRRAISAGARTPVAAVDIQDRPALVADDDVAFMRADLNEFGIFQYYIYDVAMCFSVLPYLGNPDSLLGLMYRHARISLVECQYAGDGPGFGSIHDDSDMAEWLRFIGWKNPTPIGRTHTRIRDAERTIWECRRRL